MMAIDSPCTMASSKNRRTDRLWALLLSCCCLIDDSLPYSVVPDNVHRHGAVSTSSSLSRQRGRGERTTSTLPSPSSSLPMLPSGTSCSFVSQRTDDQESGAESSSSLSSLWTQQQQDQQQLQFAVQGENTQVEMQSKKSKGKRTMRIVRLGAKPYRMDASLPSASNYTTSKERRNSVVVNLGGVQGDYNHYRNVALRNTTNRAVSIVTVDALNVVRAHGFPIEPGDLGENILLESNGMGGDALPGTSLRPGMVFAVDSPASGPISGGDGAVLLQISEPMIPCANLCRLSWIEGSSQDASTMTPRQRVEKCRTLIELLDRRVGLRGWYARVLQPGQLHVGDHIRVIEAA